MRKNKIDRYWAKLFAAALVFLILAAIYQSKALAAAFCISFATAFILALRYYKK